MWDGHSAMYNQMISMEHEGTFNQLNCFDVLPTDTVLDCGCGPGRITRELAKRAMSVSALDSAKKMLDICKKNCDAENLENINYIFADWLDIKKPNEACPKHDVVLCSRSTGLWDLQKLSEFAKRLVVIVLWANAPSIPQLLNKIFEGANSLPPMQIPPSDRRLGNNIMYNIVYDLGYEPNVRIVWDGFKKDYASREEAAADIITLGTVEEDKYDIYRSNLEKFLYPKDDGGITFRLDTRSFVMWWEVEKKEF